MMSQQDGPTPTRFLSWSSFRAKLHYKDTGSEHRLRTPPTDKNLPHPNILTCRDVGLWHCEDVWQICCRIVVSSSVGGVRCRCPCSGVWLLLPSRRRSPPLKSFSCRCRPLSLPRKDSADGAVPSPHLATVVRCLSVSPLQVGLPNTLYSTDIFMYTATPRGVQRHPRRRKMRHRYHRGTKVRKLGDKFKIGATKCHILRLKCTKFDFGWGSAPDPAGELTALPQVP